MTEGVSFSLHTRKERIKMLNAKIILLYKVMILNAHI